MNGLRQTKLGWVGFAALMLAAIACTCGPLANLTSQVEGDVESALEEAQQTLEAQAGGDLLPDDDSPGGGQGDVPPPPVGDYGGPVYDGDDGLPTAVVQWYSGPATGTIDSIFEAHNYVFQAEAGDGVTIAVIGVGDADMRLYLIDPNGNVIAEEDDTNGLNPVIAIDSLPMSGDYTARIDVFVSGSYEITITMGGRSQAPAGGQASGGDVQWATSAEASSQYGESGWSASQATGAPDTTDCGDYTTAWASATSTGDDWIKLTYDTAVIPTRIEIYETYNPGSIVQVDVLNSQTAYIATVFFDFSAPPVDECPRVMVIDVTGVEEPVDIISIFLDQTNHTGWNEIDAVGMISQ